MQAEAVSVGHTTFVLPGIGSYIASAIAQKNLTAIGWAIFAMLIVILIYDQLLFRPLVAWADKFRVDNEDSEDYPESWVLDVIRRSDLMDWLAAPFHAFMAWTYHLTPPARGRAGILRDAVPSRAGDAVWWLFLGAVVIMHDHPVSAWAIEQLARKCGAFTRPDAIVEFKLRVGAPKRVSHGMRRVMDAHKASMVSIRSRAGFRKRYHPSRRS